MPNSLAERSVFQVNAVLFGRRTEEVKEDEDGAPTTGHMFAEQRVSLLARHRAFTTSVVGHVPVVVETGVIGTGPKRKKSCPLSKVLIRSAAICREFCAVDCSTRLCISLTRTLGRPNSNFPPYLLSFSYQKFCTAIISLLLVGIEPNLLLCIVALDNLLGRPVKFVKN